MGIGPNKVYSYISVAIIGFLPLASFLIFGAQWSHLALFCQNPVFLLSDGRIPDSHAFWVMTFRTFSFLGGGWGLLVVFCLFLLPLRFSYLPGRPSWMCLFDTAHFEFLIEIFKNFCNADCRTLHPPRAVVCRPRQTREDVHMLVATIQWYCCNMVLQESKLEVVAQEHVIAQKHEFLPA